MNTSQHTPGPWFVDPVDSTRVIDSTGFHVAYANPFATSFNDGKADANARLIAASPDMLAALEAITSNPHLDLGDLVYQVRERECQGWEGDSVRQWSEAVTSVKEAIRKAKGEA